MKRILVTGAYGYLGGRLVSDLGRDDDLMVVAASRRERPGAERVVPARVDWEDAASLTRLCEGQKAVIHLAAVSEPQAEADPEGALDANGRATLRLVRAARTAGVERFVYLSTAKVYAQNPIGVITEDTPTRPQTHYAITHRLAEDYALAGHPHAVVLRLSNGIGAPMSPEADCWSLIGAGMCRQAATERRIVLKSSGLQWRNFVPISDIVSAIRFAEGRLPPGIYNVGGAAALRLFDLAELVAARCEAVLGYHPPIERVEPQPGESHPYLDYRSDRISGLGFRPTTSLDSEIDATLVFSAANFSGKSA